jgi:hypothetical protein
MKAAVNDNNSVSVEMCLNVRENSLLRCFCSFCTHENENNIS